MGLFGRKKTKADQVSDIEFDADEVELIDDDEVEDGEDTDWDEPDDTDLEDAEPADEWVTLDESRDWRDDGPFDVFEVDLDADSINRIDLGALIITPEPGLALQVPVDALTKTAPSLVVTNSPKSAVRITLHAAPADEDFRASIRADFLRESEGAKLLELGEGPFGTEIRRLLTLSDADGNKTQVAMRDWLIAGPRWVLNARFLGEAALDPKGIARAGELEEFIRNIVVRRGTEAIAPGGIVPLSEAKKK